jgi:hypothetical protein
VGGSLPERRQGFDQDAMLAPIQEVLKEGRSSGFGMTRLWANMEWALEDLPGVDQIVEYETRLNHVLPKYDDVVVCTYDLNNSVPLRLWIYCEAMWANADEERIAASLADALMRVLDLEGVRVFFATEAGKILEASRLPEDSRTNLAELLEAAFPEPGAGAACDLGPGLRGF